MHTLPRPSPIPSSQWLAIGCPNPTDVFSHCGYNRIVRKQCQKCILGLENPGALGAPNRILRNTSL